MSVAVRLGKVWRFVQIYGPGRTVEKAASRQTAAWPKRYRRRGPQDVAIIGCGQFGWSTIAHFVARGRGNRFGWCYDPDPARRAAMARRFGFRSAVADPWTALETEPCDTVYIASNHASHADYAVAALAAGKRVYVEKPVAVSLDQLARLEAARRASRRALHAGYNRPFSAAIRRLAPRLAAERGRPLTLSCTVAGHVLGPDHWYRDPAEGTRICGNVGHWLDLAVHLLSLDGALPDAWEITLAPANADEADENVSIVLTSARGDLISIVLTARAEPFEGIRESILLQRGTLQAEIADFRALRVWDGPKRRTHRFLPKDVGHETAILQPFDRQGDWQARWREVLRSSLWMLTITHMVRTGERRRAFTFTHALADLDDRVLAAQAAQAAQIADKTGAPPRPGGNGERETKPMKQVLQSLKDGSTLVETVPAPRPGRGQVVVRTHKTLISAGTERMLVDFGKANLLDKARQQPEKVAEVIAKIRTDGLATTLEAVQSKLGQPIPMGYSNVGTVTAVGAGVTGLAVGDRVVSNGHHAEMVRVPPNLCAKVPAGVGDDTAVFTVVGAIALQGIRLAGPSLGETVAVTGLGLIGLMAVQLLRAQGVRVLGIDMDPAKLDLARRFGAETVDLAKAEDPVAKAAALTDGHGVDAVLLTAATKSSTPVAQAARMCRKRGRIVLVGVTGLSLNRADFYEKELTFQVSCSYGPGRYDPAYEQHGQDYPIGFVRWTEQRNFQAVLAMMASGAVRTDALVSHRFPLDRAADAYGALSGGPALGVLLETGVEGLPDTAPAESVSLDQNSPRPAADGRVGVSFIGAGNYAGRVLAPAVAKTVARFEIVASGGGVSGTLMGRARGFRTSTTDTDTVFADPATDLVVVSTPHNSHAALAARALEAGKAAFVEKPLALTLADLDALERAYDTAAQAGRSPFLMVGFNRRFSPHVQALRARLNARAAPPAMVMTVNAGAIPLDHWTQDPAQGGGRLIGEACHFVDLARYLADAPIVRAQIDGLRPTAGAHGHDTATITLGFANGAVATIHYFANGHKGVAKERIEVFQAGAVYALDNFRRTRAVGDKGFKTVRSRGQDKGNAACVAATIDSLTRAAPAPIPAAELFEVSRTVIDLATRFDPRLGGSAGGGDDNGAAAG